MRETSPATVLRSPSPQPGASGAHAAAGGGRELRSAAGSTQECKAKKGNKKGALPFERARLERFNNRHIDQVHATFASAAVHIWLAHSCRVIAAQGKRLGVLQTGQTGRQQPLTESLLRGRHHLVLLRCRPRSCCPTRGRPRAPAAFPRASARRRPGRGRNRPAAPQRANPGRLCSSGGQRGPDRSAGGGRCSGGRARGS
jgi:hypothetical protein